jgi:hypothetical protein
MLSFRSGGDGGKPLKQQAEGSLCLRSGFNH